MARSLQEIIDEMQRLKNTEPSLGNLAPLSINSTFHYFSLIARLFAFCILRLEIIFDTMKADLVAFIESTRPGTADWYGRTAKAYQHGNTLKVIDGKVAYEFINPTLQVVKFVAVEDVAPGHILLKIAGGHPTTNAPQVLPNAMVDGFEDYMNGAKYAGTLVSVRSATADTVKVEGEVFYHAAADRDTVIAQVEAAVAKYISSLPFDGWYYQTKLIDAIQAVEGVDDVVLSDVTITDTGPTPATVVNPRRHRFYAGYAEIDPAFPISPTMTFTSV